VSRFRNFVAIDWSGAVGPRQPGIAVALCGRGCDAPALVRPGHVWSRQDVLDWLIHDLPPESLVGLDIGASLAFADQGAFFPGWDRSPADPRALWALVEEISADDPHLAATSFVEHPIARAHFRHRGDEGAHFGGGRGRLRVAEVAQGEQGLNPYSNFNLVGAAQVGKSTLTGMRVLHRLDGHIPIWPFDADPGRGSLVVEIYTSLAARAAGKRKGQTKIWTGEELDARLARFGCDAHVPLARYTDHQTDAILTSAWLRHAQGDPVLWPQLWAPRERLPDVTRTEGWTFGVL
jgi:hypothetical protein